MDILQHTQRNMQSLQEVISQHLDFQQTEQDSFEGQMLQDEDNQQQQNTGSNDKISSFTHQKRNYRLATCLALFIALLIIIPLFFFLKSKSNQILQNLQIPQNIQSFKTAKELSLFQQIQQKNSLDRSQKNPRIAQSTANSFQQKILPSEKILEEEKLKLNIKNTTLQKNNIQSNDENNKKSKSLLINSSQIQENLVQKQMSLPPVLASPQFQEIRIQNEGSQADYLKTLRNQGRIFRNNQAKASYSQTQISSKPAPQLINQDKPEIKPYVNIAPPTDLINKNKVSSVNAVTPKPQTSINIPNPNVANGHGITREQIQNARKYISLKITQGENADSLAQKAYYQQKYNISSFKTELPICVVIPSFNNMANDRYKNNINSILQQDYTNYHIVFIDDGSTDQTYNKTLGIISQRGFPQWRYTMIRNQKQIFAMSNLRRAAMEFCKPEQIFIIVDGDDQLLGRQVFKLYNAIFQSTGARFVYTNFLMSAGAIGYSRPFPVTTKKTNAYRSYPFVVSHLRAFYTKLFQLIDQKDLKDDLGVYFKAANDVAICIPILQMSGQHVQYFPELTYYYNQATGLNNHRLRLSQQKSNDRKVRTRPKYEYIQNLFPNQTQPTIQIQNKQ